MAEARRQPHLAAAANWLALANLAARSIPESRGLLIDIGSTTTDLIPLDRGGVAARGRSDTERLQTGELVYAGVRRTPVCALATELPFRGIATGLAAEIFASTLDVYLTLGDIAANPSDLSTADGRPATVEAARDRLARMVGADRDGFSQEDALAFAHAADECLIDRLVARGRAGHGADDRPPRRRGCRRLGRVPGAAAGPARHRAGRPDRQPAGSLGAVASSAGCAYALVKLAAERFRHRCDRVRDSRTGLLLEGDPA